jgi:hypothetical protein
MSRKADDSAPGDAPGFKPRRTTRVDLTGVRTELSPQNLFKVGVRVQNVSSAGFMAECTAPMRIGSYVSLDIPGIGEVKAQIRWQLGRQMGGMFLDPISLANCEWTAEKAKADEAV